MAPRGASVLARSTTVTLNRGAARLTATAAASPPGPAPTMQTSVCVGKGGIFSFDKDGRVGGGSCVAATPTNVLFSLFFYLLTPAPHRAAAPQTRVGHPPTHPPTQHLAWGFCMAPIPPAAALAVVLALSALLPPYTLLSLGVGVPLILLALAAAAGDVWETPESA